MSDHVEELNPGAPTEPRPAAAVVLLRRGGRHETKGLEVLLGKRTSSASFMADVWVFPGGALDPGRSAEDATEGEYRAAAVRELEEEAAIKLEDPEALVPFSRWITPVEVKVRYDTRFYLALAPPHSSPTPDGDEIVELAWFSPADALERHGAGEVQLVFPTIKQLERLVQHSSAEDAIAAAREHEIVPILPKVALVEGEPRILLPGDPGYEAA